MIFPKSCTFFRNYKSYRAIIMLFKIKKSATLFLI
nr:MAG TPA: hypothetical protein [Caudoviricetes sp.]